MISLSQGLYLYKNTKNEDKSQTLNIHAMIGILTHGPGVSASEDSYALDRSATVTGTI
jgi:hypothetical protein